MLGCGPCVCRTLQCRRYASENCGCWEGSTEDITNYILNWFQWTSVFNDLTPEQKEQALADAQEILEWAGDGIIPFYNAVRQWRTFANYVEKLWLTVDESGPCDSSLYEDDEAFIIYISTAGAIHCKYLALVAQRGKTPNKKLANAEEISDYLDWVTTEVVTYQFKDWDNEILSFWSVEKGWTPEIPSNPSREGYNFTGWSPAVGPISRDTTYVAQYTPIISPCIVTIQSNNVNYGTVDETIVTVDEWTTISASGNKLTIGNTVVTATAETGYEFSSWGTLPATVTGDLSITATFVSSWYLLTFTPWNETEDIPWGGTLTSDSYTVTQDWLYLWYNSSYDENLYVVTDPEGPWGWEPVYFVEAQPMGGFSGWWWWYYEEAASDWLPIWEVWTPITWNMQIRYYFHEE